MEKFELLICKRKLTKREKFLIVILGFLILEILIFRNLYQPLKNEISAFKSQIEINKETLEMIKAVFETYQEILGINLEEETIETNNQISEEEIETLIKQRENARKNKDFKLADKIRDELKEKNIVLEDTKQGVRWKKI